MILGFPIWLVAAVVGGTIVGAYFFRKRERVVEVPAISPWMELGRPVQVSAIAALMRSLPSLLAQLLIVALLCLAAWNPYAEPPGVRQVAIVIDLSATMQTTSAGRSRFEEARAAALRLLADTPAEAKVHVIGAAHRVVVNRPEAAGDTAVGPDAARADLAALGPLDVEADLQAAVRSLSHVASDPRARVIVFSDFAGTDPAAIRQAWTGRAALDLVRIGQDAPDAGIVNLWMTDGLRDRRVGAVIGSHGMEGRTARAQLLHNGVAIQTREVRFDALGRTTVEFPADVPSQTSLELRVETGDALKVNDRAFLVTPPARTPVVLVSTGNPPLERALKADESTPVRVISPQNPSDDLRDVVVVLDHTCEPYLAQWNIPALDAAAGVLLVGIGDPRGRVSLKGEVPVASITHWAASHPILADVAPDVVKMDRVLRLQAGEPTIQPLVSAGETPVIAESRAGGPKTIYWLFDLRQTDLPDRITFPVLLWNTIEYLSPPSSRLPLYRTGSSIVLPTVTQAQVDVIDPAGKPAAVRQEGNRVRLIDPSRQGFYRIKAGSPPVVAVNLLSERSFAPLPTMPAASAAPREAAPGLRWWQLTWQQLLAIAAGVMVVEWFLFKSGLLRLGGR